MMPRRRQLPNIDGTARRAARQFKNVPVTGLDDDQFRAESQEQAQRNRGHRAG